MGERKERRAWWQWVLVAFVIVSGSAAAAGLLPSEEWTRFVAGVNSGILAWGLIRPPKQTE